MHTGQTWGMVVEDESMKQDREHKNMLRREEDGPKICRIDLKSQASLGRLSLPRIRRPDTRHPRESCECEAGSATWISANPAIDMVPTETLSLRHVTPIIIDDLAIKIDSSDRHIARRNPGS